MADMLLTKLIDFIVDRLDIPKSYYQRAAARHKSLGEWLCRKDSVVAPFRPNVSPQGSFRYGTVIAPLDASSEYDLDNVTSLELHKTALTQKQIKELYGGEIIAYAAAHQMEPPEEKNRCWRLHYSDEIAFHLDSLPCLAEDPDVIAAIVSRGVPPNLANFATAITDKRHPEYQRITRSLYSSNPRGFAAWFEERTRPWAMIRIQQLVRQKFYAKIENVPPYEWRTPLQRSIQFLKRHRDVMFRDNPRLAPISMIITNLAAHAYHGETDICSSLINILEKMPELVSPTRPRVPNPAHPAEDYADKWSKDPSLEQNFWLWHSQAKTDIWAFTRALRTNRTAEEVRRVLAVDLSSTELNQLETPEIRLARAVIPLAPAVTISTPPKPWSNQ
jgi:hypothetical protein